MLEGAGGLDPQVPCAAPCRALVQGSVLRPPVNRMTDTDATENITLTEPHLGCNGKIVSNHAIQLHERITTTYVSHFFINDSRVFFIILI